MKNRFSAAILSLVMPGLGQIHNKQFFKGIILLLLEHVDNKLSHINSGLTLSFNGHYNEALQLINYDYALFYPGFYTLCVYDAVLYACPNPNKNCSFWFIISGLVGCFGIFYSRFIPMPMKMAQYIKNKHNSCYRIASFS